MRKHADVPTYEPDLYSPRAVRDTYPHDERLRGLGAVVWLARQKAYALPRYAECKQVLLDDATFVSGAGVGLNPVSNRLSRGTTLNSDGVDHVRRRALLSPHLAPRALRTMRDSVDKQADAVVAARNRGRSHRRCRAGDRAPDVGRARFDRLAARRPRKPFTLGGSDFRRARTHQPANGAIHPFGYRDDAIRSAGRP